ncbi:flagellar biosynthetic protein FliO [Actinoplanes sp. G11-F43]|uniref:flagellar biosynthetic protein FliO n=1 Tax=Actinoplanes sp. G11-F43 TaxID=3424130 RepID=UPI003D3480C5
MIPLTLRVLLALFVVLVLMWLLAKLVRRPYAGNRGGALAVLDRQQLSRGSAVAVIRVADRALVVGITEERVSLLGEADLVAFETEPEEHRDAMEVESDGLHAHLKLPDRHPGSFAERLDGSILSPRTWSATVEALRDRTTRRSP